MLGVEEEMKMAVVNDLIALCKCDFDEGVKILEKG